MSISFETECIVAQKRNVSDRSVLVSVITPDSGIIKFVKHGINSKKNIMSGILQPLNIIRIKLLSKKNGRYDLTDASVTDQMEYLRKDYKKVLSVLNIFKVILRDDIFDRNDHRIIYSLIKKMLISLDSSDPSLFIVSAYFYYNLAWCMGTGLTIDNEIKGPYNFLDIPAGTIMSGKKPSGSPERIELSKDLSLLIKNFVELRFADINKLDYITEAVFNEFRNMFMNYTGYHFDRPIKIKPVTIEGE